MNSAQCRAARAWLDWTQKDLADRAEVSLNTIKRFENDDPKQPHRLFVKEIQETLEKAGIIFAFDGIHGPMEKWEAEK